MRRCQFLLQCLHLFTMLRSCSLALLAGRLQESGAGTPAWALQALHGCMPLGPAAGHATLVSKRQPQIAPPHPAPAGRGTHTTSCGGPSHRRPGPTFARASSSALLRRRLPSMFSSMSVLPRRASTSAASAALSARSRASQLLAPASWPSFSAVGERQGSRGGGLGSS